MPQHNEIFDHFCQCSNKDQFLIYHTKIINYFKILNHSVTPQK